MGRYSDAMMIAGEKKEDKSEDSSSNKKFIIGGLIIGTIGIAWWSKRKEDKQEKAALKRIRGHGDPELYAMLEEENMRLGIK